MNLRAANTYKKVDLESAPKDQILGRLLDRCVADLAVARQAITDGRIEAKANALSHAAQILTELEASLDHSVAPEISANLSRLYAFAQDRINAANISLKTTPLDDASQVISTIARAFREATGR